jgi:hypothetical protein
MNRSSSSRRTSARTAALDSESKLLGFHDQFWVQASHISWSIARIALLWEIVFWSGKPNTRVW